MGLFTDDVRFGARMLRKQPLFVLAAVFSLAVGIGANTAIFSLVNAVLLRPLPGVRDSGRLVDLEMTSRRGDSGSMSYPDYKYYCDHNTSLDGLAAFSPFQCYLDAGNGSEQLLGMIVSGNFFDVLGSRTALGRFFLPDEDQTLGARPVAVVSYSLWQRRFGSDPGLAGKTVTINANTFTVVGVAEPGFRGPWAGLTADVWVPLMMQKEARPGELMGRNSSWLESMGRLAPGVSRQQAQADLKILAGQLADAYPDTNRDRGVELRPSGTVPGKVRLGIVAFMGILMTIVGLVLVIACSNVGAMMLARFTGRQKEVAVRMAVGARRGQVVRLVLIETMMLFVLGAGAGILLALWATHALASLSVPGDLPISLDLPLDWRVLLFTGALTVGAGLLFGLSPALHASRSDALSTLRNDAAGSGSYRSRARAAFVTAQVALSLVLLVGAALLLKSLGNAGHLDPGFDPDGVQTASINIGILGYDQSRGTTFYRDLLDRIRAAPGVESASLARIVALSGDNMMDGVKIDGEEPEPGSDSILIGLNIVDSDYFKTLHVPILRGRSLAPSDRSNSAKVAVVNQTMEQRHFGGDALGKHFTDGKDQVEIVGIAKDGKYTTVGEKPRSFFYRPFQQSYSPSATLLVRSAPGNAVTAIAAIRQNISSIEPNLPPVNPIPMTQVTAFSLLPLKIASAVAGLLGVLGLLLAAMGLFGVVNQTVVARTREIGARMALGANGGDILKMVIGGALRLTLAGIAIGSVLAFALSNALTELLYGVSPADPTVYTGVAALLASVAVAAAYLPARRAARIDPMRALRYD